MTSTNTFMEFRKKCQNILFFHNQSQNPIFSHGTIFTIDHQSNYFVNWLIFPMVVKWCHHILHRLILRAMGSIRHWWSLADASTIIKRMKRIHKKKQAFSWALWVFQDRKEYHDYATWNKSLTTTPWFKSHRSLFIWWNLGYSFPTLFFLGFSKSALIITGSLDSTVQVAIFF